MKRLLYFLLLILLFGCEARQSIQHLPRGHAHNDYYNDPPLLLAHAHRFGSIEADVFAVDSILFLAHDKAEISMLGTLEESYIHPIIQIFEENNGRAWAGSDLTFILLIDLKTETEPALGLLIDLIKDHQEVFNPGVNPHAVQVVISGNFPEPEAFAAYPDYIWFDGRIDIAYTEEQLRRIALISMSARNLSFWSGAGGEAGQDYETLKKAVMKAHSMGKKIRFWATPDTREAWESLLHLGADFINTDKIEELAIFLAERKPDH